MTNFHLYALKLCNILQCEFLATDGELFVPRVNQSFVYYSGKAVMALIM